MSKNGGKGSACRRSLNARARARESFFARERKRMRLTNIAGLPTIEKYVSYKLTMYEKREKSFESLFELMFSETENIMIETSDGYRIHKESYGDVKAAILAAVPTMTAALGELPQDAIVGLCMGNSSAWIRVFWQILLCGYRPLLMNKSLPHAVLERILTEHGAAAVISDAESFSVPTLSPDAVTAPADLPYSPRPFGTEVLFMSSGTTESVKLCAYTGENFYYQVCDSARIIAACPAIKEHYRGMLKQLVLLPLYHVFGFIAVYLWFGFFSRTFVFPRDLSPATIQNTVKKHGVTHVFAVPMVWERVARAARKSIRDRGEKTEKRFLRALSLANRSRLLGNTVSRIAFREVREKLFGDSICCLISGGGGLDGGVLAFFNGIGYPLFNGYGMTEIGITSVETSSVRALRNLGAIGVPLGSTEYLRDESTGELLVRGRARASRIVCDGESVRTDYEAFFHTKDLVSLRDGRYYHEGRMDDLINGAAGELLNPTLIEPMLTVSGCSAVCLFADASDEPVLLASVQGCFSESAVNAVFTRLDDAISRAGLSSVIRRVHVTADPLMEAGEFKISRRRVRRRFEAGELTLIDRAAVGASLEKLTDALAGEITALFAAALERDAESISADDGFFSELDGTSLDYFTLLDLVRSKYGVTPSESAQRELLTVRNFCDFIKSSV